MWGSLVRALRQRRVDVLTASEAGSRGYGAYAIPAFSSRYSRAASFSARLPKVIEYGPR